MLYFSSYCMNDFSPNDDNINWWCWDCATKDNISEPLRKSERDCSKRQMVLKTRNFWKGRRLIQNKSLVNEIGPSAIDRHSPTRDVESQLLTERRGDVDILEEKSIFEIPSHSKEHKLTKISEPTFTTRSRCSPPVQEENYAKSSDEPQKIQEVVKKRRILVHKDSDNSKDDDNTIDRQVLSPVANDHCISSQTLCGQPSLEPDDVVSAEPVIDPKWRGWFNLKEEDEETCVEILAHLSNKACSKVCDAATAMPYMLDIQVMDKHVVWPKSFRVSPPTAASVALYFFPARERDERMYDSLLDDVIERELALKAMVNNVELLIFSSYELPLQHRRFNSKYFFWGVFRQKQRSRSHSSAETATASRQKNSKMVNSGQCEPTDGANNKDSVHSKSADVLNSPSRHNLSPLSMDSSQASNMAPSKHNTPDSPFSPPFPKLSAPDKTSNGGSKQGEKEHYRSRQFYLRASQKAETMLLQQ
ncbi:hypothetical protein OROGR_028447 [Orobanche gracilis]